MVIPAGFAQVFRDPADGAMTFLTASGAGIDFYKATTNDYFGSHLALASLPNGNSLCLGQGYAGSSVGRKFAISNTPWLNSVGTGCAPPVPADQQCQRGDLHADTFPAVAAAPNGTVGIVWTRYMYNGATGLGPTPISILRGHLRGHC